MNECSGKKRNAEKEELMKGENTRYKKEKAEGKKKGKKRREKE